MTAKTKIKGFVASVGSLLLLSGTVSAGDKELIIDDKNPSVCLEDPCWCDVFGKNTLYDNENGSLIKNVKWVWRYHGQFHNTTLTHDSGQSWSEKYWEHRRFRPGIKVTFANDWQFYTEWNVGGSLDTQEGLMDGDFFDNMQNFGIKGDIGALGVNIGKHKAKIGEEWATSSNRIHTVERSVMSQETIAFFGHPWGITFDATALGVEHEFGVWAAGSDDRENGADDERWWDDDTRGAISYRAHYQWTDETRLHFHYMFINNDDGTVDPTGDGGLNETSYYNDIYAFGSLSEWDLGQCDRKASLLLEVLGGRDRTARTGNNVFGNNDRPLGDDTWGLVVLPTYDLTERLQLVGRYAFASSARSQRPHRRAFEEDVRGGQFDNRPNLEDIHTFYIGLNYKLCGDHAKVMVGYEYLTGDVFANPTTGLDDLGGIRGDNLMIAVRTFF